MHLNYLFLTRISDEMQNILSGKRIVGFHTQEKNKLVMSLEDSDESLYFEFSTDPAFLYITQRKSFKKATKNFKDFFADYFPSKVVDVRIARGDRVIKITSENILIYFLVRGRFTNIFFTTYDRLLGTFKDLKEERAVRIFADINSYTFQNAQETVLSPAKDSYGSADELKSEFPFFSKDLFEFSPHLGSSVENISRDSVVKTINNVLHSYFTISETPDKVHRILPEQWKSEATVLYSGLSALDAVHHLVKLHFSNESHSDIKKSITTYLERELSRTEKSLRMIEERISSGCKTELYRKTGTLLLGNYHKLAKGLKEVDLIDEQGIIQRIRLNPVYSPKENIDDYFERARDEEAAFEKNKELIFNYRTKREKIAELLNAAENLTGQSDLELLAKKLNIKMEKKSSVNSIPDVKFREYLIDDKYRLYVGKDSINNDLLTLHFAKKEDLWFHARSVPGSHVVLRVEGDYKDIPKSVIKTAAAVAAFYSKAKTAGLSPVAFTQKKYVIKRKGYEPGKVALIKESVIIVRPEIPENCKPINDNLI